MIIGGQSPACVEKAPWKEMKVTVQNILGLVSNFISSGSKIVKRLRRRQYDPLIIKRALSLVFGPSTALYRPFLKHCTLTNKAVGTI